MKLTTVICLSNYNNQFYCTSTWNKLQRKHYLHFYEYTCIVVLERNTSLNKPRKKISYNDNGLYHQHCWNIRLKCTLNLMYFSHWINIFNIRDSKIRYVPISHIKQVASNMGTEAVPPDPTSHQKSIGLRKRGGIEILWDTSISELCWWC
jgi:hypothetical protein